MVRPSAAGNLKNERIIHAKADKSPAPAVSPAASDLQRPSLHEGLAVESDRPEMLSQLKLKQQLTDSPITPAIQLQQMADQYAASVTAFPDTVNRSGLPAQLKAGIEHLSGFAMDDVSVHYNSNKPAQLQAHAFAQGTDIHLVAGQEQHLAHEAWHVVQQKQGRVQPTVQLKGVSVNDDAALEQEADEMGKKAESMRVPEPRSGAAADPGNPVGLRAAGVQRKVVQRISTQIRLDDKSRIAQVILNGRPPRIFGNSMGDHTTGFIVQTEGLSIALNGRTLQEAIDYVSGLAAHLTQLPGFSFLGLDQSMKKSSTKNGEHFIREYDRLITCTQTAAKVLKDNPNLAIEQLQHAINAYLIARELVPFSTVNVRVKTSVGGKGHGEALPLAVLSTYERDTKCGFSAEQLLQAAIGLFDPRSSGMIAVENDEQTLLAMSGGISFGNVKKPADRAQLIWNQHIASIAQFYPKVHALIGKALKEVNALEQLKRLDALNVLSLITGAESFLRAMIRSSLNTVNGLKGKYYGKQLNQTAVKTIAHWINEQQQALTMLDEIYAENERIGGLFNASIAGLEQMLDWIRDNGSRNVYYDESDKPAVESLLSEKSSDPDKLKGDTVKLLQATRTFQQGNPLNSNLQVNKDRAKRRQQLSGSNKPLPPEGKYEKVKDLPFKPSSLSGETESLSIQLTMDPDTGLITNLISDGRPPSPFSGTMGAHTTSWVVHLDRVRTNVRNMTLEQAVVNIRKMIAAILDEAGDLEGKDEKNVEVKVRATYRSSYDVMHAYAHNKIEVPNLSGLQDMIAAALTFYNMIPGATRDKADTGGKAEGVYRRTVLNYEFYGHGTQEEVRFAIEKLYDGQRDHMFEYHLQIMEETYPNAYTWAYSGESKVVKKDLPKVDPETENDEGNGSYTLTEEESKALSVQAQDSGWRWSVNNCLINAITDGAGLPRATADQVIRIRRALGVPAGVMLYADQRALDIIVNELGLQHLGVFVVYEGSNYTDQTSVVSGTPIYIYHDGINHFTALFDQRERLKDKVEVKKDQDMKDDTGKEVQQGILQDSTSSGTLPTLGKNVPEFLSDPDSLGVRPNKKIKLIGQQMDPQQNNGNSSSFSSGNGQQNDNSLPPDVSLSHPPLMPNVNVQHNNVQFLNIQLYQGNLFTNLNASHLSIPQGIYGVDVIIQNNEFRAEWDQLNRAHFDEMGRVLQYDLTNPLVMQYCQSVLQRQQQEKDALQQRQNTDRIFLNWRYGKF